MEKKTSEFIALDDVGNQYLILEYTPFTTFRPQGRRFASREIPGKPRYQLRDGTTVYSDSETEFSVLDSGLKLHKR